MVIRPMNAVYATGDLSRLVDANGGIGEPALFSSSRDTVSLNRKAAAGAGLYTTTPRFKIMGAVELMSDEIDSGERVLR